ncbi:DUF6221 family protein [Streptomyces sp. NPDC055103]
MDDLIAFLRARLDDDEQTARAVSYDRIETAEYLWGSQYLLLQRGKGESKVTAELDAELSQHIARYDPARVLAEVDAKRQIAREHGPSDKHTTIWDWFELGTWCGECGTDPCRELTNCPICGASDGCRTLRLLALPYADHPDYQDAWRP